MNSNNKIISIHILIPLLLTQSTVVFAGLSSAEINISSSFNPVGSGARALGMGSAFIAIADDATAASWNPSGLMQIRKPELAFVGNFVSRQENSSFSAIPQADTDENVSYADVNYASASIPCDASYCGKNMVFSINYQSLYNFDRTRNQNFTFDKNTATEQQTFDRKFDYKQSGNLHALGLAFAIQLHENFSFGFSLNFWEDILQANEWKHQYRTFETVTEVEFVDGSTFRSNRTSNEYRTETNEFSGFNANIGAFWTVYEQDEQKIILGAVVKTPFTADVKRTINRTLQQGTTNNPLQTTQSLVTQNEEYEMPISYGLGVSYQMSDAFTMAADVYRTEWSDFIRTAADGRETIAFGSTLASESKVKATTQVRLGAEYRIISQDFGANYIIPIRSGIFYDPIPTNGSPDSVYGVSIGTGIAFKNLVFDIAYQYRFGSNLSSTEFSEDGFSQDLDEHTLYTSLFIRF